MCDTVVFEPYKCSHLVLFQIKFYDKSKWLLFLSLLWLGLIQHICVVSVWISILHLSNEYNMNHLPNYTLEMWTNQKHFSFAFNTPLLFLFLFFDHKQHNNNKNNNNTTLLVLRQQLTLAFDLWLLLLFKLLPRVSLLLSAGIELNWIELNWIELIDSSQIALEKRRPIHQDRKSSPVPRKFVTA